MSFFYEEREGVLLLRCRELLEAGAAHAFSTRIGGVSKGPFESLNLGPVSDTHLEVYKRQGLLLGGVPRLSRELQVLLRRLGGAGAVRRCDREAPAD